MRWLSASRKGNNRTSREVTFPAFVVSEYQTATRPPSRRPSPAGSVPRDRSRGVDKARGSNHFLPRSRLPSGPLSEQEPNLAAEKFDQSLEIRLVRGRHHDDGIRSRREIAPHPPRDLSRVAGQPECIVCR